MKNKLFLLGIIWSPFMFGQTNYEIRCDTINRIDNEGQKQGIWKEYRGDGSLIHQYDYLNDKKEGAYLYFEDNGNLSEVGFHHNNEETGWSFEFRNNKLWRSRSKYGTLSEHYDNQLPKKGGNFKSGSGQQIEFFENGTIMEVTNFSNFKLDGYYSKYFINGQLKESGMNKLNQPWTIFCAFDSLGNKLDIGNIVQGTGTYKHYNSNGQLQRIEEYSNGRYWNIITYYSIKGESLFPGSLKNGEGEAIEYSENGRVKSRTKYSNGIKNGEYSRYYENGKIELKGSYVNGLEDGDWIYFAENEKRSSTYHYKMGLLQGISDH